MRMLFANQLYAAVRPLPQAKFGEVGFNKLKHIRS
jgi:hypothetical protein